MQVFVPLMQLGGYDMIGVITLPLKDTCKG